MNYNHFVHSYLGNYWWNMVSAYRKTLNWAKFLVKNLQTTQKDPRHLRYQKYEWLSKSIHIVQTNTFFTLSRLRTWKWIKALYRISLSASKKSPWQQKYNNSRTNFVTKFNAWPYKFYINHAKKTTLNTF